MNPLATQPVNRLWSVPRWTRLRDGSGSETKPPLTVRNENRIVISHGEKMRDASELELTRRHDSPLLTRSVESSVHGYWLHRLRFCAPHIISYQACLGGSIA